MASQVKKGDFVVSTAGRDFGNIFLTVDIKENFVYIVDGKKRKIDKPKKKNIKHIKKYLSANDKQLAERINNGNCVGNSTVYCAIKAEKAKKQED